MKAWLAALLLTALPAGAEVVRVQTQHQSEGQAWLFGAQADGACWLAVPLHVVEPYRDGPPAPFVFHDAGWRSGESGVPIAVASVPGGVEAAGGVTDLAFAPVIAGRMNCNSRLGLAPRAYVDALRTQTLMRLSILQDTSIRMLPVNIVRQKVDEAGGGELLYAVEAAADQALLNAGISGSTVEIADARQRMHPFAMTLKVRPDKQFVALRFDRLRAAFERVVAASGPSEATLPPAGEFAIAGIRGIPAPDGQGLAEIAAGSEGCWRATLAPDARTVDVVLDIPGPGRIEEIRILSDESCGPSTTARIEMLGADGSSSIVRKDCDVLARADAPGCRVNRPSPLTLRLRLAPVNGTVSISAILLR